MDKLKEISDFLFDERLKQEGITRDDLNLVDLSISFSPVIPFPSTGAFCGGAPCDVIKTVGGKYMLLTGIKMVVDEDMLKLMRYRFLTNRH